MGKVAPFCRTVIIGMLVLTLFSCKNADMMVVAEEQTKVFKSFPESGPPKQDEVVAVLNKGDTVAVLHSRYSKDFMYYKVRLSDGREGYVWVGDKFRVVKKQ